MSWYPLIVWSACLLVCVFVGRFTRKWLVCVYVAPLARPHGLNLSTNFACPIGVCTHHLSLTISRFPSLSVCVHFQISIRRIVCQSTHMSVCLRSNGLPTSGPNKSRTPGLPNIRAPNNKMNPQRYVLNRRVVDQHRYKHMQYPMHAPQTRTSTNQKLSSTRLRNDLRIHGALERVIQSCVYQLVLTEPLEHHNPI